jgi:hypothetical protein
MASSSIIIKGTILIIFAWQIHPLRHWFYFLEDLMFDKKKRNKKTLWNRSMEENK